MLLTKVFERIQKNTMKAKNWGKLRFHTFFGVFELKTYNKNMHCTSPGQKIQKKVLSGNFFLSSLTLSGKLSAFALTFPRQTVNGGLCACPKICNKGKKRKIYGFFFGGGGFSGCFLHLCQNCWGSDFKTAFYVSREKLQRNLCWKTSTFWLLFGLLAEIFQTLSENFQQSSQNRVLRS